LVAIGFAVFGLTAALALLGPRSPGATFEALSPEAAAPQTPRG